MNKQLILFTASFPYGKIEQFLETEIIYLAKSFEQVLIIPSSYMGKETMRPIPENVTVTQPIMGTNKFKEFTNQIFNTSPIVFLFKEIIKTKAYKKLELLNHCVRISLRARSFIHNKTIKNLLKTNLKDSVIYFYWGCYHNTFIQLCSKINAPIVVRYHGSDLYNEINKGGIIFYQENILRSIDHAIFVSQSGEDYIKKNYPNVKVSTIISRLGILDNGIGMASTDGIFRVVSCSNVIPLKRIHLIIETLKQLTIETEWTHIGEGGLLEKLKQESKHLPPNISVKFLGLMENKALRKFYSENPVDVFINVSQSEGVPVSVMEALSAGIPVFATNVGGTSELVNDEVGELLETNFSTSELADHLLRFYNSNEQRKTAIRKAARKRWEEMSNSEKVFPEFMSFLLSVKKARLK